MSGLTSGTTPYHVISTGTANGYNATSSRMLDMLLTITPGNAGINLGTASTGTYTTLAMGSTAVTITGSSVVSGSAANIGVKSGGSISINGSSSVAGTIYADTGIAVSSGGAGAVGGVVQNSATNAALNQAALDANAASASYALLPATNSTTSLSGSTTITGTTGRNVMNLTSVSVNGNNTITINAPAGSSFIINVSGTFDVNGSSSFKLSGGIRAADVLWNVTGAGTMKLTGSSEFNGILLVPNRDVTLNGSNSFTGAVICGGSSLDIKGNSSITGAGAPTTSPADAAPALATLHWAEHGAH